MKRLFRSHNKILDNMTQISHRTMIICKCGISPFMLHKLCTIELKMWFYIRTDSKPIECHTWKIISPSSKWTFDRYNLLQRFKIKCKQMVWKHFTRFWVSNVFFENQNQRKSNHESIPFFTYWVTMLDYFMISFRLLNFEHLELWKA